MITASPKKPYSGQNALHFTSRSVSFPSPSPAQTTYFVFSNFSSTIAKKLGYQHKTSLDTIPTVHYCYSGLVVGLQDSSVQEVKEFPLDNPGAAFSHLIRGEAQ
jgi:hypothetical protein